MISDNIKRLRENAGLSQSALARKLGVSRASVNAWEMELSAPTAQYLIALAQLFHTTTDDILGLESQEQIVDILRKFSYNITVSFQEQLKTSRQGYERCFESEK